ncbi:MAG: hypothetical protein ACRDOB_25985 [Streptosporangiaceae bacterium]
MTLGWLAARLQAFAGLHPGSGAGRPAGPPRRRGRRAVNRASPGLLAGG